MAQKHLKELLKEDQEPFYLKDYIADRKCQIKKQAPKTKLQLKKQQKTTILCKNSCFFSLQDSPDLRKSPKLFDFPPSPLSNKSPTRVFLNVPAKTASLLLEAAIRIQKQKSKPKSTTHIKNSGFTLFGSMLKRLNLRKNNNANKLKNGDTKEQDKNKKELSLVNEKIVVIDSVSSYSSNSRRLSSSLDLESSSSGRSFEDEEKEDNEEFEFTNILSENSQNNNNNGDYFSGFCLSPLSPFHFALQSPELQSPVKSPLHCKFEDQTKYEYESKVKFQEDEEEEDKEQNSPVSVLDPPFEDDYDGHEDDTYDVQYALVHRSHQELLQKLQRFEKLAVLDPIELEKRMIEAEQEYLSLNSNEIKQEYNSDSLFSFENEQENHEFLREVIRKSGFQDVKKPGIKRLISDLIIEEDSKENNSNEQVIKRICKRLESWKEVESNTIEMMVEMDLRNDLSNWKNPRDEINKSAIDIEVAIFAILVDELVEDMA